MSSLLKKFSQEKDRSTCHLPGCGIKPFTDAENDVIRCIDLDGGEKKYASSPLPGSYINPLNNVDMNGASVSVTATNNPRLTVATSYTKPLGAPRNYLYYSYELIKTRPEAFSPANSAKIANGAAPTVDAEWIAANATHAGFEGDLLIHHHIDQGNIATALPKTLHEKWTRDLHLLKYPKPNISGGLNLSINILSLAVEIFSKNPNTIWNSTFGNGLNVGQIYINPEGGYYQVLREDYYYDKDGNKEKAVRLLEFYKNFGQDKDGNYIGIDNTGQKIITTDYKKNQTNTAEML